MKISRGITTITVIAAVLLVGLAVWYFFLDEYRRTYLKSIIKQIKHMPGRYSV